MPKKIIYFIVALVLVVSFGSIVIQPQAVTKGGVSVDYTKEKVGDMSGNLYTINKDEVTTYGWPWTAITKTVKKEYTSAAAVPDSIYYEEYIDGKWYHGKLKRTGEVEKLQYTWRATFTGKINY
ncbi:hypothetical protein GY31_04720 [Lysinibacillus sphaericus]|uniref:hypothetical protein n=1 Tax=Lysinibacillus TaxID=400634 RepID=UPI00084A5A94|nr:hypothetical protein [Lysinibacillus sphaericus]OEC03017.1 hypothetical protein GY31_04720 [Lysinibacillus sphaericus]